MSRALPALVVLGGTLLSCIAIGGHLPSFAGSRLLFDGHDIGVYFRSSRWLVEGGPLYREVFSEYPLLANLVFAVVRWISETASGGGETSFSYWWVATSGVLYAFVVTRVSVAAPLIVLIAWLAPAPIYFALVRYDVYPAAATLFALLATRRGSYVAGALWLGVAVALKGHALFVLPAYCAFILNRRGSFAAAQAGVLAILPMILGLAAVYAYAGWDGMTAPFRFYQVRGFNGESSYDALHYLFGVGLDAKDMAFVPAVLQIGCALLAAAMRPRSFSELADAMSFAILGFVSFSMFYSPQFVLWILPFIAFASSRVMAILGFLFAASTYAYFPVAFNMALGSQSYRPLLELTIVIVTVLRFGMMGSALRNLYRAGRKRSASEASAGI